MIHPISTLASDSYFGEVAFAVGVLAVLVIVVVIVGIALHRKFKHDQPDDYKLPPFDLNLLRQMHQEGHLTQEEYDRAVAALLAQQSATGLPKPNNNEK